MLVSEKIFELIKEKGLTQKDFSKRTGIAESTISDWKRKGLNPSVDKLSKICDVLEVSPSELLGMEEPYFQQKVDYSVADGDEQVLLEAYHMASPAMQRRVLRYLRGEDIPDIREEVPTVIDSQSEQFEGMDDYSLTQTKNLVKRLRKLARLDRIRLDESEHQSGLNKHLFAYFDYIGIDKLEFVKNYISHLQPFMISEIRSQERFENAVCVIDEYYRISIYIKVDATKGEEVIVSFHENNKNGIAKRNSLVTRMSEVYVFADSIGSQVYNTESYTVNLFITRGVRTFPINVPAHRYDEEGFIVRYQYINNALIDIVNQYLEDLYTSDLDIASIELFSSLQQLSFTSYGNDVFSNISMLIDSLIIQKDALSKQVADSALCIYCGSLYMIDSDKKELIDTLEKRYSVNSVRIMPDILERVKKLTYHEGYSQDLDI